MPSPRHLLLSVLILPACATPTDQVEEETGDLVSTGMASSSGSSSSTGEDVGSSSTTDDGSTGEIGSSTSTSTSTSTGDETSTGEEGSSSTSTGVPGEVCGDGLEGLYESCDDGNDLPGDGCSNDCKRWDWSGIATDLPEEATVGWSPCWSSLYSEQGSVGELLDSCTGAQMMLACRPVGSPTFTVLAHAPREAVLTQVPEFGDTWAEINGSAWQWTADQLAVFDPEKPWQSKCTGAICWPRIGDSIIPWGRCGDQAMDLKSAHGWERVVLQSYF